jgi:hypothetical protein
MEMTALWCNEGFGVPEILDLTLSFPGNANVPDAPYLVLSLIEGRTLQDILKDPATTMPQRQAAWRAVLTDLRCRHDRAIATAQPLLAHPDSNTRNIMIGPGGVFYLDLEARQTKACPVEAAAIELGKLCRWAVGDLGAACCREILEPVLDVYRDRRVILERIVQQTLGRPFQWVHRRRDRRLKARSPGQVTKYDIADALADMLQRA